MNKDVYEIAKVYMQYVSLKADVYDVMKWQLKCGATDTVRGKPGETDFRDAAQTTGFEILAHEKVMEAATDAFVTKPLVSLFSLGMYDY